MGSSAKKKKEKRKDFQKPKLKVGKTRPKASNFTDTSFKAKSIVLAQQSLSTVAPSGQSQFEHHLSLLNHKSSDQKRESLAHLTSAINSRSPDADLPLPVALIIPKVKHLIVDGSNSVRTQLLKLLQALPTQDVSSHAHELLLWTHAAMTHMAADIRSSGLDVLNWLLSTAGEDVVSSAGGYVRTLKCFISVLAWNIEKGSHPSVKQATQSAGGWSSTALSKPATDPKLPGKTLQSFALFISAALSPPDRDAFEKRLAVDAQAWFPLTQTAQHMIATRSNAFGYLNLFGAPLDEDGAAYEDREERQEMFVRRHKGSIEMGLQWAKKEQGEVGRAAKALEKAIRDGLEGYEG
ncbi:Pre-rRNA-processing protein ipi1 [Rhizodiscina lignyota]|uniref:Pre-rRNA-processing protein n=1 Tax=Rhizodiscina lignyota TaxID=1504668 RepID=A0A9P4I640_9PEZI|nr:Pre-rRNA-processing protein ipi1 [Rhizodiscina lignyota]